MTATSSEWRQEAIAADTTVPVMTVAEKQTYRLLASIWLVANIVFWSWWGRPSHIVTVPRFLLTSFVIAYTLAMPAYFIFFLGRMRRPNPALALLPGLRVTFATTFVPGAEGVEVLERTVIAMRDQIGYPHDVWVLDEGNTPEVRALCARVGVHHFSRKGIDRYQAPLWPFKAKTKAGNYNAWLDWMRSRGIQYDILLQMDTDHVPQPGYMMEMLRPFADPAVAYVAAPSITSGNRRESWAVAARYEVEATLHGALQMGYNGGYAPLIIGSHAAFRVAALERIGGFQHTLAEDHHNTLRLNAAGMSGLFSPDAIAIGDGATCFADAMVQEYQWARALTQVLLNFFPKDGRTLRPRLWAQFLFAETWYPLFALTQLIGWLSPIIALLTGRPWVRVDYFAFFGLQLPVTLSCLGIVWWVKRRGWLRPRESALLSWRSALLMLARWPFVLMAVAEAVLGWITKRDFPFRVTPKGARGVKALPIRLLAPYAVIVLGSLAAIAIHLRSGGARDVDGYLYLALVNAALYVALIVAVMALNIRENLHTWRVPRREVRRAHMPAFSAALALLVFLGILTPLSGGRAVQALVWRPGGDASSLIAERNPADDGAPGSPTGTGATIVAGTTPMAAASVAGMEPVPPTQRQTTNVPAGAERRTTTTTVTLPADRPFLGIYDPVNSHTANGADVEEVFVQWKPAVAAEIRNHIARIVAAGRVPIVTVEPYAWNINDLSDQTLLADIAAGRYDGVIKDIGRTISSFGTQPVYLRFAQEMDLAGTYPWSQGDPFAYVRAYRQFVDGVRAADAANARFVWSPSGNAGSADYYPGRDVVDAIGVTVLVAQRWEEAAGFATPRPFAQVLAERYPLAVRFNKPMIVAEVGVDLDDPAAKSTWLASARASLADFPAVLGVVYFDDRNPPMSHLDVRPEWQLTPEQRVALFAPQSIRGTVGPR
jgi:cellulose synthase (UDP-forming)